MALIEEFEKRGNWLFKRRSWIPMLLFLLAIPVIMFDQREWISFRNIGWSLGCLLVSFSGLAFRIWAIGHTPKGTSGRNTKEGQIAEKLNISGIYSIVRHPLYLGNFLMWLGIILYTGHTALLIFTIGFFWIYYERIMFAEEAFIRRKFGEQFEQWSAVTPPFIPLLKGYCQPELSFSVRNVLKREYTGFFLTILVFSMVNVLKSWSYEGVIKPDLLWLVLFPLACLVYIILRTIKKQTRLLHVEGR